MGTNTLNNISDCRRELVISISQDEFSKFYQESISNLQKKIKMPGFRPGKVPVSVIKSQYGGSIQMEAEEKAANSHLKKYIESSNINLVGQPALVDIAVAEDKTHTYKIEFDVIPDFELGDYKSISIDEPTHRITDEDIEKEILRVSKSMGTKETLTEIKDFDTQIIIDSYRINSDTEEVIPEVGPEKNISIDLSQVELKDLKNLFIGAKVGDELIYNPDKDKKINSFSEKIVVKEIFKMLPLEIDDEFAKKASQGKFDNIEDFKQEVGFGMQKFWDDKTRRELEIQISDKLIEMHEGFSIPQALLDVAKEQIEANLKKQHADLNNPHVKRYIDSQSDKLVRLELVRDKIIEKEKIEIEDYDIESFADKYFAGIGQNSDTISRETLSSYIRGDERTMQALLQNKLMDLLLDFTTTQEVTFDNYNKKLDDEITAEIAADEQQKHKEDCTCSDCGC